MSRTNKIYFTKEVIDSLITDTINKVSGIDKNKDMNINFNDKTNVVNINFSVKNNIDNVFSVIREVQNYTYLRLCKMFDLNHITIDINIK